MDIRQLSDVDLMGALTGATSAPSAALQNMSNADLLKALGQAAPQEGITADNLARSAVHGIPAVGGLADKFAAGMDALTNPVLGRGSSAPTLSERYAQNLDAETAKTNAFDTQHPIVSTAANLAGGTAALGGVMSAAPAAASAFGFGGGPLLGNVAKGAITSAALGGADALTRGQDPVTGAEWGGALGAAAPVAGRVIGAIANRVAHPVTPAENVAVSKVAGPLKEAGLTTPEAVQAHLDSIGPEASLVDANPRLTQYGGTIAASPGPGQAVMRDFATTRAAGAGDRILSELDSQMGKPIDLGALSEKIYNEAKTQAGPLFKEAYGVPVQSTPELDAALNTPLGKLALSKAKTLGNSEPDAPVSPMLQGKPAAPTELPEWAQGVIAKGGPGADNLKAALAKSGLMPDTSIDVRGLHLTRQALDDMIQPAVRSGQSQKARILQGLRSTVDQTLKSVEPMAQADSIYSSQAEIRQAMEDGMNIFRNNQTPQDIAANLSGMSEAERQGYLQGGRAAIRNVMGTARNDAAAARAMFAKEFNQEKLAQLVGEDGAASILKRIGAENTYAAVNNRITGNSETAARAMGKADLADAHGLPSYHDVAVFSGVHGLVRRAVSGALKSAYDAVASGRQKEIELSMAKLLTAQGVDRTKAVEAVMRAALKADPSGKTNRIVAQVVARIPAPDDPKQQRPSAY